jgi:thiamine-monophosphate kinase
MMDISDGLSSDLAHVCIESRVGAIVEESLIPVSDDARSLSAQDGRSPVEHALDDGEDFELLLTLSETTARRLILDAPEGLKYTIIGHIEEGDRLRIRSADGRERTLEPGGYEHLRG